MYGIYNLGFLALNTLKQQSIELLDWWELRCLDRCYRDINNGIFVDQLWINFVPSYYSETHIIRHLGINMAPWNLHERKLLSLENNKWLINNTESLLFYHFSSFDYLNPEHLNKPYYNRFNFDNRRDLKPLYKAYLSDIIKNNVHLFSNIKCNLYKSKIKVEYVVERKYESWIKRAGRKFTPPLLYKAISNLKLKVCG